MAVTPKESGHPSTLETRVAELERFCGQLALENAALKKPCRVIKSYNPSGRERHQVIQVVQQAYPQVSAERIW